MKIMAPTGSPPPPQQPDEMEYRSPFTRGGKHPHVKSMRHSNRQSTSSDSTDYTYNSSRRKSGFIFSPTDFSTVSSSDDNSSVDWSNMQPQAMGDVEVEKRRLKLELWQTMAMYNSPCKEAPTASSYYISGINWLNMQPQAMVEFMKTVDSYLDCCKEAPKANKKAPEFLKWRSREERRIRDVRHSEVSSQTIMAKEAAKSKAAFEAAEAQKRIAEPVLRKKVSYRRYSIEEIEIATEYFAASRKIGVGGYGPVFKCCLDHTLTVVKVLCPDAAQGRSQFEQEVDVLSGIWHPNIVLLLGACPEYSCLVYEYMHNGSLEDRLFCRGGTPPLSWQHRFRIGAEIATGLFFLQQTKPEPLVHRDLKPANILLDRNLVSKISDVGLARLVPPTVADDVTRCRMASHAGTFCYIDPEFQQTGRLGVKSDVYSLGMTLLQLITALPPLGLAHHVEKAIERGTFEDMLDPAVPDWPIEEALSFAKMTIRCAELRPRDRPDLGTVVLPELCRLRNLAEESLDAMMLGAYDGYNNPKSERHAAPCK